ncbi:hypothetical protein [Clostridium tetani]|nr:hypothetical protein [Clostridium tetani]
MILCSGKDDKCHHHHDNCCHHHHGGCNNFRDVSSEQLRTIEEN